ncbi:hypothetical protein JX265_000231 [Neoarthrinium moseri]|uniref:Calcineurin-like phosphoesterase domain-containing protein n=1 Tax=Neoarthrinium moseri TaxID=1658444 RepID=A0A9P9WY33_9PEZI|nr:hypothetical protein JX266_001976 [Neoarthrinium moseri]KAI1881405.1 hypothetical protein JX265_000231 [Neoarthrinium moseri]
MGILQNLGLRRRIKWENLTLLDEILNSPLQALVLRIYLIVLWLRGNPIRPPPNKTPIRIVCLADTHDAFVEDVPEGDLLIHAGDMTSIGTASSIQQQINWLANLPHRHKVLVTGNHDSWFDKDSRSEEDVLAHKEVQLKGIHLLNHKAETFHFKEGRKLVVYGNPSLPRCGGKDNAFQYDRDQHPWAGSIPLDTEILVTHTPPRHHLDLDIGCAGLTDELWNLRTKPKLHVFGHVHCGRGTRSVFWDDCQRAYEDLQARDQVAILDFLPKAIINLLPRGIIDLVPSYRWVDALKVLFYGLLSLVWQFLWQGGRSEGSLMVNAGCQDGVKRRLNNKRPFVIEI